MGTFWNYRTIRTPIPSSWWSFAQNSKHVVSVKPAGPTTQRNEKDPSMQKCKNGKQEQKPKTRVFSSVSRRVAAKTGSKLEPFGNICKEADRTCSSFVWLLYQHHHHFVLAKDLRFYENQIETPQVPVPRLLTNNKNGKQPAAHTHRIS